MADSPPLPRPRGRPKADEPGSSVSTWLRQQDHDRLVKLARAQDQSVSALVRQLLAPRLR